eukprot:TRINITY_DN3532_c1_g1_i1.p1 TRINITY_DN3532_c1_g1~~TRINITY_DN3532_c1_g1_i1.p1  ORF type:complete len:215 (-),score=68.02 TRINITY_DN3532_c1_g1_i1:165-809(-)
MSDKIDEKVDSNKKEKKEESKEEKVKKKGLLFKAKKNLSEKFITSKTGKKIINKILDDEMKTLISTVKEIISVETGKKEIAEDMERNTIKIITKCYFLVDGNHIKIEEFKKCDDPMKKALKLILKVYDRIDSIPKELRKQTLEQKFMVIAILFEQTQEGLKEILKPHVTEKSLQRIEDIFKHIANHEFFHNVWFDTRLTEHVKLCMETIRNLAI